MRPHPLRLHGSVFLALAATLLLGLASFAVASDSEAGGAGRVLWVVGGSVLGAYVLFRIHPVLGILGVFGGIMYIVRVLG